MKVVQRLTVDKELRNNLRPLLADEREQLEKSLLAEGCREPIVVWQEGDAIADGHNRYEICTANGVPFEIDYLSRKTKAEVLEWQRDNQFARRNLTPKEISYYRGQDYRAAKKPHGGDRNQEGNNQHTSERSSAHFEHLTSEKTGESVAEKHGVGQATVRRDAEYSEAVDRFSEAFGQEVKAELLAGDSKLGKQDTIALGKQIDNAPELVIKAAQLLAEDRIGDLDRAVLLAEIDVRGWSETTGALWQNDNDNAKVRFSAPQLKHLLAMPDDVTAADLVTLVESGHPDVNHGKPVASVHKAHEIRKAERAKEERERKRAEHRAALKDAPMPDRKYELLYADPPWRYEHSKTESRAIENHYPTMDLEEIKTLEVPATDDSVLFLWATSPKLSEAMEVMEAWGFGYRTCMVWVKDKIGMGYYARQRHELLLIGVKGEPGTPEPQFRPDSVMHGARLEHSAKPEVAYTLLEDMYPNFSKVELFSRRPREGWDAWGNEASEVSA